MVLYDVISPANWIGCIFQKALESPSEVLYRLYTAIFMFLAKLHLHFKMVLCVLIGIIKLVLISLISLENQQTEVSKYYIMS